MSTDYLIAPAIFLIDTLFSLYILALFLRFLFQWVDADYYNPISQFLIKITHPPLRLFRRFIPALGRVDTASLVLIFTLETLDRYLIIVLQGMTPNFPGVMILALAKLLESGIDLFFFAIVVRALLSWISSGVYNPAIALLYSLTEPLLRASRRLLPPISGIDLSPLIPLIGLQLLKMILLPPLHQAAGMFN